MEGDIEANLRVLQPPLRIGYRLALNHHQEANSLSLIIGISHRQTMFAPSTIPSSMRLEVDRLRCQQSEDLPSTSESRCKRCVRGRHALKPPRCESNTFRLGWRSLHWEFHPSPSVHGRKDVERGQTGETSDGTCG